MTEITIKRITLYILTAFLGIVLIWQLSYFIPGFLLAITLYILMRKSFFNLTEERKVKKTLAALMLIFMAIAILALPIWLVIQILIPKITYVAQNSGELIHKATVIADQVQRKFPQIKVNNQQIQQAVQRSLAYIPGIFGTTAAILANLATAFFVVYFMLKGGKDMEQKLIDVLPLKEDNKLSIWIETKNMIVSNAIGIPLLAICQGIIAVLGYWIFNVEGYVIWGMVTGFCSLLPVIGTMIVWIPIVIYLFAMGDTGNAIGLLLFSAIVISNIDNVLRFTIMRKLGDVHPLITVFGVIVGLQLFGFIGLIFGPLFISYFILMIKIYQSEFRKDTIIIP